MSTLARYNVANIDQLVDRITRNSIGMEDYFNRVFTHESNNYPPYNLVAVTEDEFKLEIALAGFSETDVKVFTERGKLVIEGAKATDTPEDSYVHRGLAQRSFTRAWTIADDTEVKSVEFVNGLLTVTLGRIVPEKHQKKFWYGADETDK
jgi:HSP20 family molecular chaperone IbpA